jgi:hypothetical protein
MTQIIFKRQDGTLFPYDFTDKEAAERFLSNVRDLLADGVTFRIVEDEHLSADEIATLRRGLAELYEIEDDKDALAALDRKLKQLAYGKDKG